MTGHDLLTTPAGRLALLFKECERANVKSTQQNPVRVGSLLRNYLAIADNDDASYFAAVAEIMSMPVAVRRDVASLESPPLPADILLRHIARVESALTLFGQQGQSVRGVLDHVTPEVVESLETCSHILALRRAEVAVSRETLSDVRRLATEIIDELAEDDNFRPEFREEIRRHAQSIVDAVNLYKVHGADGLKDQADALVGVYVRHRVQNADRFGESTTPVLQRLADLAGKILIAVAAFTAPAEIAASANAYAEIFELPSSIVAPSDGSGGVADA
nr:hypothetical protein [Microbacterium hydrocarbonoxydans]